MDELTELERLAKRAEQQEQGEADALAAELEPEPEQAAEVAPPPEQIDAGANRAESFLRLAEGGVQMFLDDRIALSQEELQQGREKLGPAIAKHNLAGAGTGRLPYQEEVEAGFFLGRLIKGCIRRVRELRASDEKKATQKEQEHRRHGAQPQYTTGEQSQPVSGQERVREEPDIAAPVVN